MIVTYTYYVTGEYAYNLPLCQVSHSCLHSSLVTGITPRAKYRLAASANFFYRNHRYQSSMFYRNHRYHSNMFFEEVGLFKMNYL
jgi:hypothetical protein